MAERDSSAILNEHTARFDSIDSQLQTLTQMVRQILERLPENPKSPDSAPGLTRG